MKGVLGVSRVAAVLATVAVVAIAGAAMVAFAAAETPSQSPAVRGHIALEAAVSTLGLIKPARSWIRLPGVPVRERRWIGSRALENDELSREERSKLQARATFWVTRSTPQAILAYVRSRLPRDATAHGEFTSGTSPAPAGPPGPHTSEEVQRHEKVEVWTAQFTLPPASGVLRRRALAVEVARGVDGRFVIRLEGGAVWAGIRPSYTLLATNVHVVTIANTFPVARHAGPSPAIVSNPSFVQELVALINAIPVFEDKGAEFSCPSEKPGETSGSFLVTFAEQPGAPALATLEGQPYGCGESFLPIISVPGHPPLELDVEPALTKMINRIAGLHIPNG